MGSRYLVTGAQLGTLIALCQHDATACNNALNKIVESQMVGDSTRLFDDDLRTVKKIFT